MPRDAPSAPVVRFTGVDLRGVALDGRPVTVPRPGSRLRGRLLSVEAGTMQVLLDDRREPAWVPLAAVRDLQVLRGKRSGVRRGALIGAAVGAGMGLVLDSQLCSSPWFECSPARGAVVFGGLGALAGTTLGLVMGGERWAPYEPRAVAVSVMPRRGGLAGSLTLHRGGR